MRQIAWIKNNIKLKIFMCLAIVSLLFFYLQYEGHVDYWRYKALNSLNYGTKERKKENQIVFVGDSITQGCNWNAIFFRKDIINKGVGGYTTSLVLPKVDEVVKLKPSKIFVLLGINDIRQPSIDAQDRLPRDQFEAAKDRYKKIIRTMKNDLPTTKIYIETLMPVDNDGIKKAYETNKMYDCYFDEQDIVEFNKFLREYAKNENLELIDLYSQFSESGKLKDGLTFDGVHPSTNGYFVIKKSIEKHL